MHLVNLVCSSPLMPSVYVTICLKTIANYMICMGVRRGRKEDAHDDLVPGIHSLILNLTVLISTSW